MTFERFIATPHVLVTFRGQLDSALDEELGRRGLRGDVLVGVSRFDALPGILDAMPLLTTVPARVARHLARAHRLTAAAADPARSLRLLYRRRDMDLAELSWFRGLVCDTARRTAA